MNRIRKLMAMASCEGASEGEVLNALALAKKLMEANDIAEVTVLSNPSTAPGVTELRTDIGTNELYLGIMRVATVVTNTKFFKDSDKLVIYGYPTDVSICREFYKELHAIVRSMVRVRYGKGWGRKERDYCAGFCAAMYQKAKAEKASPAAGAIILVRDAKFEAFAKSRGLVLRHARQIDRDGNAYSRGQADGKQVDLGCENRLSNPVRQIG